MTTDDAFRRRIPTTHSLTTFSAFLVFQKITRFWSTPGPSVLLFLDANSKSRRFGSFWSIIISKTDGELYALHCNLECCQECCTPRCGHNVFFVRVPWGKNWSATCRRGLTKLRAFRDCISQRVIWMWVRFCSVTLLLCTGLPTRESL